MDAIADMPLWIFGAVAAFVGVGVFLNWLLVRGRATNARAKIDWDGHRLEKKRPHWREMRGRRMKSYGFDIFSVSFSELDHDQNRRLSELLREKDVEAAAMLMEIAGVDEKEAIDRAERYTLREHPDAETRGYPADYPAQETPPSRGARRVGFSAPAAPRRSTKEILAKVEQPPAPKPSAEEYETRFAELIRRRRRMEAMQLYMDYHAVSMGDAQKVVDELCPPSMWIWKAAK